MKDTSCMKNTTYIGMDLGGTKLLIGEVSREGKILREKRYPSDLGSQQIAAELMTSSLDDFLGGGEGDSHAVAIGAGMPGRVDAKQGVWLQIDPERTSPIPLGKMLEERFGLPCFIDNDVKSATLAEQRWGYGCVSDNFVYINVGTGVGAGIIVDGKMVYGFHWDAGEVGYTSSGLGMCLCDPTQQSHVEAVASGAGMDSCARKLRKQYATRLPFPTDGRIDIKDVFKLEQEGDELCHVLVEQATQALRTLIGNIARTIDPEYIVLGGGVVADGYLLKKMKPSFQGNSFRFVKDNIVLTKLNGHETGLLGAAAIAMKGIEK